MNIPISVKVHVSPHLMSNMSAVARSVDRRYMQVEVRALREKTLRMCSDLWRRSVLLAQLDSEFAD